MLIQYFRRGGVKRMRTKVQGEKVIKKRGLGGGIRKGCFMAFKEGDELTFGWSLCNTKAGDEFVDEAAKTVAMERMDTEEEFLKCPPSMQKKAQKFLRRAKAYYKE